MLLWPVAALLQPVAALLQPVAVLVQPVAVLLQPVAGMGPTANQWPSPTWKRQCRRLKDNFAKAQESANAIMEDLHMIVQAKADS